MFSSELSILALYGIWLILTIVVQVLLAIPQLGLVYLATARDEGREATGTAARAMRCVENSVVAMAMFAPAILILNAKGVSTGTTLLLAQLFLLARIAYVPVYLMGVPWLRTGIWAVGAVACLLLYFAAL